MDLTDHLADQFTTSELVLVAEQIGLAPTSRWSQRQLVDAITAKLGKEGIPEPPDGDVETLPQAALYLEEFLYMAGYVDDNGNPVKRQGKLPLEDYMALHHLTKKPDCYGSAWDTDPACKRCLLYIYCAEERIAKLPPCFAVLWDGTDAECRSCIDMPFCRDAVLAKSKEHKS